MSTSAAGKASTAGAGGRGTAGQRTNKQESGTGEQRPANNGRRQRPVNNELRTLSDHFLLLFTNALATLGTLLATC